MDSPRDFIGKAAPYAAGRKGYASAAAARIAELAGEGAVAADVGAGTGLFSETLLGLGYTVYAVEPLAQMRQQALQRLGGRPGFHLTVGSAEATTLPARSVDIVTAASAYHWFDPQAFGGECRRVLRGEGWVFLLCNARVEDDFTQRQGELCRRFCPRYESLHRGADLTDRTYEAFFQGRGRREAFIYDLTYTQEQFLARSLSSSYAPGPEEPGYAPYRDALQALIQAHARGGRLTVANRTLLWYGSMSAVTPKNRK